MAWEFALWIESESNSLKMKLPSLQSLYSTAMVIAVGGIGGIFILRMNKLNDISGSPYFREAFKILRAHQGMARYADSSLNLWCEKWYSGLNHSGAVQLLGEPIKQLGFDPVDVNNWCDGTRAKFHVRVKGPKDKGISRQRKSNLISKFQPFFCLYLYRNHIFLGHHRRRRKMDNQSTRIGTKVGKKSKTSG